MTALIHPLWLRLCHWLNALAVIILVMSGWRIYDASPFFFFRIPHALTLGGWLGGAIQWHFAAMWLLGINGIAYLAINLLSGRLRQRFFPLHPAAILADLRAALRGTLSHADPHHYNAVQKAAYLGVIGLLMLVFASGLVLWKSVQFAGLRELLGGYESARRVHFLAMTGIVSFVLIHLGMVARVPKTLLHMIRGH